ncbi:unnamed protein product [Haemonchus placei]|uniref:BAG domain-containing protein n=1 Tax=Haemonchus placei TaxID=6290 RepID=A0A158QN16_HAEPC|nr:unnamed protein product [Haemonchus placei]
MPSSKDDESKSSVLQRIEELRKLFVAFRRNKQAQKLDAEPVVHSTQPTKYDDQERTLFEDVQVKKRPAVSLRRKSSIKWKTDQQIWGQGDDTSVEEIVQHRDFRIAQKITAEAKKSKMIDTLLSQADTEVLRNLFESELARPTFKVFKEVKLLHVALNKLWEEIMCNIMKYNFEHEVHLFLCEREKVKARILDVMLICPQNLPDNWGSWVEGSNLESLLKSVHYEDAPVIPSPVAQSVPSQWTKHMKEIEVVKSKMQDLAERIKKQPDTGRQKVRVRKADSRKRKTRSKVERKDKKETVVLPAKKEEKLEKKKEETVVLPVKKEEKLEKKTEEVKESVEKSVVQEIQAASDYDNVKISTDDGGESFDPAHEKRLQEEIKKAEKGETGVIEMLCQQDIIVHDTKEQKEQVDVQKDTNVQDNETSSKQEKGLSGKSDSKSEKGKERVEEDGKDKKKGHIEEQKNEHSRTIRKRVKQRESYARKESTQGEKEKPQDFVKEREMRGEGKELETEVEMEVSEKVITCDKEALRTSSSHGEEFKTKEKQIKDEKIGTDSEKSVKIDREAEVTTTKGDREKELKDEERKEVKVELVEVKQDEKKVSITEVGKKLEKVKDDQKESLDKKEGKEKITAIGAEKKIEREGATADSRDKKEIEKKIAVVETISKVKEKMETDVESRSKKGEKKMIPTESFKKLVKKKEKIDKKQEIKTDSQDQKQIDNNVLPEETAKKVEENKEGGEESKNKKEGEKNVVLPEISKKIEKVEEKKEVKVESQDKKEGEKKVALPEPAKKVEEKKEVKVESQEKKEVEKKVAPPEPAKKVEEKKEVKVESQEKKEAEKKVAPSEPAKKVDEKKEVKVESQEKKEVEKKVAPPEPAKKVEEKKEVKVESQEKKEVEKKVAPPEPAKKVEEKKELKVESQEKKDVEKKVAPPEPAKKVEEKKEVKVESQEKKEAEKKVAPPEPAKKVEEKKEVKVESQEKKEVEKKVTPPEPAKKVEEKKEVKVESQEKKEVEKKVAPSEPAKKVEEKKEVKVESQEKKEVEKKVAPPEPAKKVEEQKEVKVESKDEKEGEKKIVPPESVKKDEKVEEKEVQLKGQDKKESEKVRRRSKDEKEREKKMIPAEIIKKIDEKNELKIESQDKKEGDKVLPAETRKKIEKVEENKELLLKGQEKKESERKMRAAVFKEFEKKNKVKLESKGKLESDQEVIASKTVNKVEDRKEIKMESKDKKEIDKKMTPAEAVRKDEEKKEVKLEGHVERESEKKVTPGEELKRIEEKMEIKAEKVDGKEEVKMQSQDNKESKKNIVAESFARVDKGEEKNGNQGKKEKDEKFGPTEIIKKMDRVDEKKQTNVESQNKKESGDKMAQAETAKIIDSRKETKGDRKEIVTEVDPIELKKIQEKKVQQLNEGERSADKRKTISIKTHKRIEERKKDKLENQREEEGGRTIPAEATKKDNVKNIQEEKMDGEKQVLPQKDVVKIGEKEDGKDAEVGEEKSTEEEEKDSKDLTSSEKEVRKEEQKKEQKAGNDVIANKMHSIKGSRKEQEKKEKLEKIAPDVAKHRTRQASTILSRQLNRRKELIRALFQGSADRALSDRIRSAESEQAAPLVPLTGQSAEKTVFEKVDTVARPVLSTLRRNKTRFKNEQTKDDQVKNDPPPPPTPPNPRIIAPQKPKKEPQEEFNIAEIISQRDFNLALRVMIEIKKHRILEDCLDQEETEKVRQFFDSEMSCPSYNVMRLIHEALNKCWEQIMDKCEEYRFPNEVVVFLCEREKRQSRSSSLQPRGRRRSKRHRKRKDEKRKGQRRKVPTAAPELLSQEAGIFNQKPTSEADELMKTTTLTTVTTETVRETGRSKRLPEISEQLVQDERRGKGPEAATLKRTQDENEVASGSGKSDEKEERKPDKNAEVSAAETPGDEEAVEIVPDNVNFGDRIPEKQLKGKGGEEDDENENKDDEKRDENQEQ